MPETRKETGFAGPLIVATVLLVLAFGTGVVVGRVMLRHRQFVERRTVNPVHNRSSTHELAACQRQLAVQSKASTTASASPMAHEKVLPDDVEPDVKIALLKDVLAQCDYNDVLVKGDICKNHYYYLKFMMFLPNDAASCVAKEEIADLRDESYEVCAELNSDTTQVYFDIMELSKEDRDRITGGFNHYSRKGKRDNAQWREIIIHKCLKETGQLDE